MIHRNLDSDGDFTFGNGKQDYLKDLSAVLLNIKTRLKSWKGDSFSKPGEGVDYKNYLDKGTKTFLDSDVKRVILQSEGVIKIKSYSSGVDRATREFSAQAEILTIFGPATVEV